MLFVPRYQNGNAGCVRSALPPGGSTCTTSAPKSAKSWLTCAADNVSDRRDDAETRRAARSRPARRTPAGRSAGCWCVRASRSDAALPAPATDSRKLATIALMIGASDSGSASGKVPSATPSSRIVGQRARGPSAGSRRCGPGTRARADDARVRTARSAPPVRARTPARAADRSSTRAWRACRSSCASAARRSASKSSASYSSIARRSSSFDWKCR